ncbi:methyl-accepting chemotaxis protein [Thalassotalea fusca]
MKFNHKIVAASSIILLLALSLLSFNQYFLVKNKLEEQVNTSVAEILQGISNSVQAEMSGKTGLAELTTELIEQNIEMSQAARVLSNASLQNSFILIGFGYEDTGKYVASDPNWNPGANWEPRARPWYVDAKQANKTIVTEPYADAVSKEILVSVGTPVHQSGRFAGAIFFDVSLAGLSNMINKVNMFNAGYAFMVSKGGVVISHPNSNFNGKPLTEVMPNVNINSAFQQVTLGETDTLVSFEKVEGFDWYVGVALDKNKAFMAVDELSSDSLLYSIISLIFGIGALLFIINYLMKPLSEINEAMSNVAQGNADLTVRLKTNSDPEFAALAHNFNLFTEMLQKLIGDIKQLGHDIYLDAQTTSQGAQTANQAMHNQLTEIDTLATATNEMAATSKEVANTAKQAADAVRGADEAAIEGGNIVQATNKSITSLSDQIDHAVQVLSHLEVATNGIENILAVINGIAEQTNLLALNAAIEAARAGESGRGFAVVADEVRTLAQRTQEATDEIKTMIDQLQSGAKSAVTEMNQSREIASSTVEQSQAADAALESIRQSIQTIVDLNVQISASADEQSVVVEEINRNAYNIKDISHQVSDEADNVNVTMLNQVENIKKQEQMLEQFKA